MIEPLVFEPYLRPQIWGGRNLDRYGKHLPDAGMYGESWELSGHPHHVSIVAEGPHRGKSLTELSAEHASDLFSVNERPTSDFPLLIKLLDCQQLLSVQVHPDDSAAARLRPGERGKTEAWIVLEAAPTAEIFAGLKTGIRREEFQRHIDKGTTGECLHRFRPQVGDCLFIPAGTVHTLGGGIVVAEVQQSSDVTFRLFDWNRVGPDGKPRPLHIEESLESINWNSGPVAPVTPAPLSGMPADILASCLVESRYFSVARYDLGGNLANPYRGRMSIWMVLKGEAILDGPSIGYRRRFHSVETVLIPASCPACSWQPASPAGSCQLLLITLPTLSHS